MKTDWHNLYNKIQEKRKKVTFSTMQIIAFGFLGVIFLGSILLYLPISNQEPIAYLDALFVSVSAVCVTGLVTVVPAVQFTVFGKIILLLLIQIGGLGVIACTMAVFLAIRKKITMKSRVMIQQTYNLETLSGMVRFIIRILKGTVLVEGMGAVLFAFYFVPEYGFIRGLAYGVFHSVSAFCNAGIDILGTTSFMEYVKSPLISLTTMFLIVAGGLGFTVWHDMRMNLQDVAGQKRPLKRLFTRLHLQSKMVIVMTAGLIMIGTLGYFLLEYHNDATIGKLGFGEKLLASGFQSVTTRTAGFATVSQAELTSASKLFGCILMFIGGSPGGTAGGIKTTTMAILLLTCAAVIRGRKSTECFGRRLAESNVRSGIAIVFLTFAIWLTGLFGLAVLEPDERFIDLMYEATSAIGTVGLSADLTPSLTRGSHVILMILMYVGRIGPITMALVFAGREDMQAKFRDLPEKRIMLG